MTPATYSAREKLRDGRLIHFRALRPDDEADMLAAVDQTNAESLRRRFFVTKRKFSTEEKAFFLHVDFVNHVALVAVVDDGDQRPIVGGCRYIVTEPGKAEVAFVVIDAYQGQGIGTMLTRHLAGVASAAGLKELVADVLPENTAMRSVLCKCGFQPSPSADQQVVHLILTLASPSDAAR